MGGSNSGSDSSNGSNVCGKRKRGDGDDPIIAIIEQVLKDFNGRGIPSLDDATPRGQATTLHGVITYQCLKRLRDLAVILQVCGIEDKKLRRALCKYLKETYHEVINAPMPQELSLITTERELLIMDRHAEVMKLQNKINAQAQKMAELRGEIGALQEKLLWRISDMENMEEHLKGERALHDETKKELAKSDMDVARLREQLATKREEYMASLAEYETKFSELKAFELTQPLPTQN